MKRALRSAKVSYEEDESFCFRIKNMHFRELPKSCLSVLEHIMQFSLRLAPIATVKVGGKPLGSERRFYVIRKVLSSG